jgi:hypothetical protein
MDVVGAALRGRPIFARISALKTWGAHGGTPLQSKQPRSGRESQRFGVLHFKAAHLAVE